MLLGLLWDCRFTQKYIKTVTDILEPKYDAQSKSKKFWNFNDGYAKQKCHDLVYLLIIIIDRRHLVDVQRQTT